MISSITLLGKTNNNLNLDNYAISERDELESILDEIKNEPSIND